MRITPRHRGKTSIRSVLQTFGDDDRVAIRINPHYQSIPHPRFNGRTGTVVGSQGRAYYVEIIDGEKRKRILVSPEHLRRV